MNLVFSTDRQFHELKQRISEARDERIRQFRSRDFPLKIIERKLRNRYTSVISVRFRFGKRELKQISLKDLKVAGVRYTAGMVYAAGEIAKLDAILVEMTKQSYRIVDACTRLCLHILEAAEAHDMRPGRLCTISTYEFSIDGPYSPLPYQARKISQALVHRAFICASQKVMACNRLRKWTKSGKVAYTPRVCPGILVRESQGITPSRAEWGFFIRRWPSNEYHYQRSIRSRRERTSIKLKGGPNRQHIRSFRLKPFINTYLGMGEFVAEVMRLRNNNRTLWEFVRTHFIAKRDLDLLGELTAI